MVENITIKKLVNLLKERGQAVNASAVRFWEGEGFLSPERSSGNHRLFPELEREKAYLLALISALRRELPHSALPYRREWEQFCEEILEMLRSDEAEIQRVKSQQRVIGGMLERLKLADRVGQVMAFIIPDFTIAESTSLRDVIVPSGTHFSGDEATIARSVKWEREQTTGFMDLLPMIADYAWSDAVLRLQFIPPTDVAGQLSGRYKELLGLLLPLSEMDMQERRRVFQHELLSHLAGFRTLLEIRRIFDMDGQEILSLLTREPRTRDGLLTHILQIFIGRLEDWQSDYERFFNRHMTGREDYLVHIRGQLDLLRREMSGEADSYRLQSLIDGVESQIRKEGTGEDEISVLRG